MKKTSFWGFTVDDVGLDGYSTAAQLDHLLDFLDENKIIATFFAVPLAAGKRMDRRRDYVAILRDAIRRGHEIAQHGLTHDRFEIGIPPEMGLSLPHEGPARKFLAENREKLKSEHTPAKIRGKLREGRKILEDAIGTRVHGFRSPALQACANLFIALAEEEYFYDSSTYLQKGGWDILNKLACAPQAINRKRFAQQQKTGLRELPLTTEYTWYLGRDNFERAYNLAVHDFDGCLKSGIPFVNLCHVAPLQAGKLGFELYRRLIGHARAAAGKGKYAIKTMPLFKIAQRMVSNAKEK